MYPKPKTWIIIAALVAVIGVVTYSVWQARTSQEVSEKPKVLTTFTVLADMARNVAGDRVDIESITKPGAEIHGYEPTPQDIARLQGADMVMDNGMNLELWASKLYQNAPDVPHVTLTDGIAAISITEGPYENKPNPHAWMSPTNALVYVDNITAALTEVDPTNADYFQQKATAYKDQIQQVDTTLRDELDALPESNRYLVSCEGAFSYLIRDYDLRELYLWPISADAQGTPQQIRHVVDQVKQQHIPAVFCESTISSKAQEQVASESGSRFAGTFYVDSLSDADGPTPTYLKLLEYNATTLITGLKGD